MQWHRFQFINFFIIILCSALLGCSGSHQNKISTKKVVGATEDIYVVEVGLGYRARIDTGARTTSIHAMAIEIENYSLIKKENIGKKVSLTLENGKGEKKRLETVIAAASEVRNAQGVEVRYMVPLTLRWQGVEKNIQVNLRDRSSMTYKLLIGRDWLSKDFVVDVDNNPGTRK